MSQSWSSWTVLFWRRSPNFTTTVPKTVLIPCADCSVACGRPPLNDVRYRSSCWLWRLLLFYDVHNPHMVFLPAEQQSVMGGIVFGHCHGSIVSVLISERERRLQNI